MKKKLRTIAVAGVVGSIAIVAAQQGLRSPAPTPKQTAPGAAVASPLPNPFENSALILLSQYFCRTQDYQIERAKADGRNDLIQPIIKATCASNLAMMRPEMQTRQIAGFQIETYAPNDRGWDAVAKTPSLAKDLLMISVEAEKVALEQIDWIWSDIREDTKKLMAHLQTLPEYRNASSKHERNLIMYREDQKRRAANPPLPKLDKARNDLVRYEQALSKARAALTKPEQQEFDMLIDRFKSNMAAALAGKPAP